MRTTVASSSAAGPMGDHARCAPITSGVHRPRRCGADVGRAPGSDLTAVGPTAERAACRSTSSTPRHPGACGYAYATCLGAGLPGRRRAASLNAFADPRPAAIRRPAESSVRSSCFRHAHKMGCHRRTISLGDHQHGRLRRRHQRGDVPRAGKIHE